MHVIAAFALLLSLVLLPGAARANTDTDCEQRDNPDLSIRACTQIINRGAREQRQIRALAYAHRGTAWADKDEPDKAIADFTKAIELDPTDIASWFGRGNAYLDKRDMTNAIADYTRAIKIDPKEPQTYYNRGNAYMEQGEDRKAIADFTAAIRLKPETYEYHTNRGMVYARNGEHDLAIADFTRTIAISPKSPASYARRADSHAAKGNREAALADQMKAVELSQEPPYKQLAQARLFELQERKDDAVALYRAILSDSASDDDTAAAKVEAQKALAALGGEAPPVQGQREAPSAPKQNTERPAAAAQADNKDALDGPDEIFARGRLMLRQRN